MSTHVPQNAGFTLIELMIVVAILGILAAMAIPQFSQFIAKSKRLEAVETLRAVNTAQLSYAAGHEHFLSNMSSSAANLVFGFGPPYDRTAKYDYRFSPLIEAPGFPPDPRQGYFVTLEANLDDDALPDLLFIKFAYDFFQAYSDGVPILCTDDILNLGPCTP